MLEAFRSLPSESSQGHRDSIGPFHERGDCEFEIRSQRRNMGAQELEPNVQGFLTLVTVVSGRLYGCVGDLQNDLCAAVS